MKKFICIGLISILGVCSIVRADDADLGTWDIDGTGVGVLLEFEHNDADPHKGNAFVYVTNTGNEAWGDFHFEIYDPYGGSQDISNVHFLDAFMTDHDGNPGFNPTSTQSPLTWTIDNVSVGAKMDLFFYSDPVLPGNSATFNVYTDNIDELSFFGLMIYPTPVPEPATICLLGLGLLALRKKG